MALRSVLWVSSIGLGSAFPLHTRQASTSNSHSAKIIAPVIIVAVPGPPLLPVQMPLHDLRGADDAEDRVQVSTKSLPAYNEQAGDEEIVLVRRAERQSESDEDEDENNDNNNNGRRSAQATSSNAPDSRPLLDDDSSPDMPRVSLASSSRGRSLNDHPDQPSQSQSQSQSREPSQLGHAESIAQTTTVASSIADTEPEPTAAPHPPAEVPSYTEAMSTSHVNLPTTTEHTAEPSMSTATDDGPPVPVDADATVRPKRKSVFRHLDHPPSLSSLSLILTRSQSPTMSRTSLNISAPIPTTLVRTELSYPRAGPTPEQIRFLSSRESLGRFGMPYGEQAIAAAKSRENLPPVYKPRVDAGAGAGADAGGAGTSAAGNTAAQEDEPTLTIRRGPILLTPGELANKSENAASERPENDRADQDPMTIREEPIDSMAIQEDSKSIQEEPVTIQEEPVTIQEEPERIQEEPMTVQDGPMTSVNAQESRGTQDGDRDTQVEPRVRRESPYDNLNDGRRESVMTTHSFVTATEGQGDSSPPTPTAETYQVQAQVLNGVQPTQATQSQSQPPVRTQTVLIPQSHDALHPELTLVPATPIG
ncbi:hypothetical protein OPQ81_003454 [Rhizoctonia solani]|nr:hypothetical protein OPQ81_003454 [Rhizoctonia solani]